MNDSLLTKKVLASAFKVHTELGPGLLESVYQNCLAYELTKQGLLVEKEKELPVYYDEVELECGYRIDLLVEYELLVEIKSVEVLLPIHLAQTITYLKLSNLPCGLLLNFNVRSLKDGIKRVANGIEDY
jgi:GxxExxY protein